MRSRLSKSALEALRWKYQALTDLREKREGYEAAGLLSLEGEAGAARRAAMQRVAHRFPGALRELEALTAAQLMERGSVIEGLLVSGDAAPLWLVVLWEFHRRTQGMLLIKRVGKRKALRETEWPGLRAQLMEAPDPESDAGLKWLQSADVATLNRYLDPQRRRMVDEIWWDLSVKFQRPVEVLRALMLENA